MAHYVLIIHAGEEKHEIDIYTFQFGIIGTGRQWTPDNCTTE